jgi:hypothetical protein
MLRAASISVRPLEIETEKMADGKERIKTVTKCELREISIVTIPSNRQAIRLLDEAGEEITIEKVLQLHDRVHNLTPTKMDLKTLAKALNLADTATEAEILAAATVAKAAEVELSDFKKKIDADRKAEAVRLFDAALAEKRVAATERETFLKLSDADHELFKNTLSLRQKPQSLAAIANAGAAVHAATGEEDAIKLYDKHDRAGTLAKLKREQPEEFSRLFEAKFGKKPA